MECIPPVGKRQDWICHHDVWEDNDWRAEGRRVTVVARGGGKVTVVSSTNGRRSNIDPERMRPTSTGYRLSIKTCPVHGKPALAFSATTHTVQGPREYQEDRYVVKGDLIALCDGMGGHAHGDLAAQTAIDFLDNGPTPTTEEEMRALIIAAGDAVNRLTEHTWRAPGCTLVMATLFGSTLTVGWCGDSRAYVRHEQVTSDHGDGGYILYKALGAGFPTEPEVLTFAVAEGDTVVLVSDGVSDVLPTENIAGAGHAQEVVDMAMSRGLKDNATAVVATVVSAYKGADPDPEETTS